MLNVTNPTFFPLPANQYDALAYYYANSTYTFGTLSKADNIQQLINIDYSTQSSSAIVSFLFAVNIGSAPPLLISSPAIVHGTTLQFVASEGVAGTVYTLSITITFANNNIRTDTLEIDVPSDNLAIVPIANVINQGTPYTGDGAIFINSGIRLFVAFEQPQGPNVLDQWNNLTDGLLYEFVSNGLSSVWVPIAIIPLAPPVNNPTQPTYMEQLSVSQLNTLPPLSRTYDPTGFIVLIVNGVAFAPVGNSPPFSISGNQITWLSTLYSITPGDDVKALYTFILSPSNTRFLVFMERLTITTTNVFPPLTNTYSSGFALLSINNQAFIPVGNTFSIGGNQITWLDSLYAVTPGSDVKVLYTYSTPTDTKSISMENVNITTLNTFPHLLHSYAVNGFFMLIVDGQMFMPTGASPPFSVSGNQITWLSTVYAIPPGSNVVAIYEY